MEIKYTNYQVDEKIYGKKGIVGLIDKTGDYIFNNFYDVKNLTYNKNFPTIFFLLFRNKQRRLAEILISELELNKELRKRKMSTLSESELAKVLMIKALTSSAKTLIIDSLDMILTPKSFEKLINTIKSHSSEIDKTIIFTTNKMDNILKCDKYIIVDNNNIIYNGKDLGTLPIQTETAEFTNLANKKGANLKYYKEVNDLLKAVYRSLQ